MTTVLVRAFGGKSHSWLTPTISRSNPNANSISVADGSNDTIRITSKTLSQFERILFIEEILPADLLESSEAVRPAGDDFFGGYAGLQLLDGIRITNERDQLGDVKPLRVEFLQNRRDFQSYAHGAHRGTIGNAGSHAAAALAGVQPGDRDERLRGKVHSREMALVERRGDIVSVQPGRSEFFKRCFGAAANGDSGVLQNFNAGIKNGTLGRAQIRRGRNPSDASAFKEIVAMPVLHGDDVQVGADVILGVEELRELSNGEPVAHRQWKIRHEISFVGVEHRAFHNLPAERIGAVQDKKSDVAFGGFLHAIGHRRGVRVEAHARILNIEYQRVDSFQHFVRGAESFAVEAVNRQAGRGVFRRSDFFVVAAGEPVFRAE